ncbi:MAG: multidrug effflux MFS transporter, partial [Alphaproteobacteria bacterium]
MRGPSLWLLAAVVSTGQLAVTIYLPSLAFMAEDLGTTQTWVQLVVTVYLATFGLAQLITGPLSDNFGRRPVLLAGISLYTLASLGAALAPDIQILLIARIFQAIGGCASLVVMRAIIRDTAHGAAAAKANSYLGMSLAVAPALAPIIGGQLETWFDWRASFYFTAIAATLVLAIVYFHLAETLPADKRRPAALSGLAGRYFALVKMPAFMGYSLLTALLSAGFQGYMAAAPIIFIVLFGIPAHLFGWYTIAVPIGFTLGNYLAGRLTARVGMDRLILISLGVGSLGGTIMLLTTAQDGGLLPTLILVVIY